MPLVRDRCICLRETEYSETAQIFTLFSREVATLTEWSLREGRLELRRTLRGMYLGLYAGELVGRLIEEHDAHPDLFDRLDATLSEFGTARREEAFLAFQLDLLRETGYLAELTACVSCGNAVLSVNG